MACVGSSHAAARDERGGGHAAHVEDEQRRRRAHPAGQSLTARRFPVSYDVRVSAWRCPGGEPDWRFRLRQMRARAAVGAPGWLEYRPMPTLVNWPGGYGCSTSA
jgi:hypothetical protein